MSNGIFVTGTDTGVGKTAIACGVVRYLKSLGMSVGVMKPIATGDRDDAKQLIAAAGIDESLDVINPQFFKAALAPRVAASLERRDIDMDAIYRAFWYLHKKYKVMVVEGIGGVRVPTGESTSILDLIQALRLPALVVARATLGTLNHSLLTLEALDRAKISIVGAILNGSTGKTLAEKTNVTALQDATPVDVLGEVRRLPKPGAEPVMKALAKLPRFVRAIKRSCREV